ncbi:MAG: hypothetical protein NVV72_12310 [Asticcacaulis sp.]|nr:hypothetical protein [Asticcacaulis sp.]
MKKHDFGNLFHCRKIDPISELAEVWSDSRYEFNDKELSACFERCKEIAVELNQALALETGQHPYQVEYNTAYIEDVNTGDATPESVKSIEKLNFLATNLYQELDKLNKNAQKIGLSSFD